MRCWSVASSLARLLCNPKLPLSIILIHTRIRHPFFRFASNSYSVQSDLRVVTICLPESYVDGMDKLIKKLMYPNRSEVIRIAIRDLLVDELWGLRKRSNTLPLVALLEKMDSVIEVPTPNQTPSQ